MAIEVKDAALFARISAEKKKRVTKYLEAAAMREAELVRVAVDEYMVRHPIKEAV